MSKHLRMSSLPAIRTRTAAKSDRRSLSSTYQFTFCLTFLKTFSPSILQPHGRHVNGRNPGMLSRSWCTFNPSAPWASRERRSRDIYGAWGGARPRLGYLSPTRRNESRNNAFISFRYLAANAPSILRLPLRQVFSQIVKWQPRLRRHQREQRLHLPVILVMRNRRLQVHPVCLPQEPCRAHNSSYAGKLIGDRRPAF